MNSLLLFDVFSLLPLLPIVVVFYVFLVPPFFREGKNEMLFLQQTPDGSYYLIIVVNFSTVFMGRGGSSERHMYRIKKIDLQSGETLYCQKSFRFWAKFLGGYLRAVPAGHYLYANSSSDNLSIIDLRNGLLVADTRRLLAANPEVAGIAKMNELKINPHTKLLQCYNIEGRLLEINPETLDILPPGERGGEEQINYDSVYDLPGTDKHRLGYNFFHLRLEIPEGSGLHYEARWKQESEGRRYKLVIENRFSMFDKGKYDDSEFEHNEKSVSFIQPELLSRYSSDTAFLKNPYRFLVKHQAFLDQDKGYEHTYLSLVNGASEQLWQVNYGRIIHPKLLASKEHSLYVKLGEDLIWVFWADSRQVRMSVSAIYTDSGLLAKEPLLVKNFWLEKSKSSRG